MIRATTVPSPDSRVKPVPTSGDRAPGGRRLLSVSNGRHSQAPGCGHFSPPARDGPDAIVAAVRKPRGYPMDQRIINLYDRFTHGGLSRREFLDRLAELAGSTAAAAALLPLLQNDYAQAAIVAADDARLAVERVSYESPKGKINGYLVRAKASGKRPAVIVIHENRGLNPHIEDVARRLAVEGYLALAPDLLSVNGGTPPEEDKARELHTKTEREDMIAAALAGIPFMLKHAESTGKVGAVGFCFGGGVVNRMAAGSPDLAAAVPYYGLQARPRWCRRSRRRFSCNMPR